jgi:hypothetical protein
MAPSLAAPNIAGGRRVVCPWGEPAPPADTPDIRRHDRLAQMAEQPARGRLRSGVPLERQASRLAPQGMGPRLHGSRAGRPSLSRLTPQRNPKHGASRNPAAYCHVDRRASDGSRLPALRHCGGGGPEGGWRKAGCLSRATGAETAEGQMITTTRNRYGVSWTGTRKSFVFCGVGGGVRTHGHWNHNHACLRTPLQISALSGRQKRMQTH